jgi:hypothetical protein
VRASVVRSDVIDGAGRKRALAVLFLGLGNWCTHLCVARRSGCTCSLLGLDRSRLRRHACKSDRVVSLCVLLLLSVSWGGLQYRCTLRGCMSAV